MTDSHSLGFLKMGTKLSTSLEDWLHPEVSPRADRPTTFDPQAGFTKGRKERKMIATTEEMDRWVNFCLLFLVLSMIIISVCTKIGIMIWLFGFCLDL